MHHRYGVHHRCSAIPWQEKVHGEDDTTIGLVRSLGAELQGRGRTKDAIPLYIRQLEHMIAQKGANTDNLQAQWLWSQLAAMMAEERQEVEAEQLAQRLNFPEAWREKLKEAVEDAAKHREQQQRAEMRKQKKRERDEAKEKAKEKEKAKAKAKDEF